MQRWMLAGLACSRFRTTEGLYWSVVSYQNLGSLSINKSHFSASYWTDSPRAHQARQSGSPFRIGGADDTSFWVYPRNQKPVQCRGKEREAGRTSVECRSRDFGKLGLPGTRSPTIRWGRFGRRASGSKSPVGNTGRLWFERCSCVCILCVAFLWLRAVWDGWVWSIWRGQWWIETGRYQ